MKLKRDMLLWVLSSLLVLFSTVDLWYFVRGAWAVLKYLFQDPVRDVLGEQVVNGRVLLHDIDYMGHMNNARYLRECDFARLSYYARNGMFKAFHALGARMVIGASTIRYRRSLGLGEAFELRSRIMAWDEKSFFVEQRFVSKSDGFISAVILCRQNVIHSTPDQILQHVCKRKVDCPDIPEDLQHWINFISANSQALRAECGLDEKTK
ncbi:protein THEM6 isoform X2 [Ictalurus punctatus]|uniref:Protein THEM6 n=1 Tax=Ictalurus punctatus TaxID=7998 RepID=A0A979FFP1_ICTPU|nr:protein THEM6 isoform X2 [Ictalurus punctatus]XP_053529621.1 protein THEM6 isoform X2 [Ictalurus punctatus]